MDAGPINARQEPSSPEDAGPRKRLNIDAVLLMAKYDGEFRKKLFADRSAALDETGLSLSHGEKLLLGSISNEQLSRSIHGFRVPGIARKSLANWSNGPAVLLLLVSQLPSEPGDESQLTSESLMTIMGTGPDDRRARRRRKNRRSSVPPPSGITPDEDDPDGRPVNG